jgi:hypothetical protein
MSMSVKQKITPQRWTTLWNMVGVRIRKRNRAIKNYNAKSDISALVRVGVDRTVAEKLYSKSLNYHDELLFKKFSSLFRRDIPTVQSWLNAKNVTDAFNKLFNVLNKGDFDETKKKFAELALIFQYYKKGDGYYYEGKVAQNVKLNSLPLKSILSKLGRNESARYSRKGVTELDKSLIFWIEKKTDGEVTTQKFIKLSKNRTSLKVVLSVDSKREYGILRLILEKHFKTYLDTPEVTTSLRKFNRFLSTGISKHFILCGCSYIDSEFRLSIAPSQNRIANVAEFTAYKNKLQSVQSNVEAVSRIRIAYRFKELKKPIFISILTYKDGILGAIILNPDGKRLSSSQKIKFTGDFTSDFGVPPYQFITYDDLGERALYEHFLQSSEVITNKIQLRSNDALRIYQSIISEGLMDTQSTVDEDSRLCVNQYCPLFFVRQWTNRKYCNCGEAFIPGKSVEIRKIEEKKVAKYLVGKITSGKVVQTIRQLLRRKIEVVSTNFSSKTADIIPITNALTEAQLEILKFRYPHCILITSRKDQKELINAGFEVTTLSEVVFQLRTNDDTWLKKEVTRAYGGAFNRARGLCTNSFNRIDNTQFYKTQNVVVKNYGAELFEADCSTLFNYVFGNSVWLGAKYRGVSLPDGMTAFPMLNTDRGCFIWDGKFSEGRSLVMGNFAKNKKYILDAKNNRSIKANGGLKAFIFVSNNKFPTSFEKKYKVLTKNKRIKISFLRASELKEIAEHYRQNESLIHNNSKVRERFIDSMVDLLFSTTKNRKCEIIDPIIVKDILDNNEKYYKSITARKSLSV